MEVQIYTVAFKHLTEARISRQREFAREFSQRNQKNFTSWISSRDQWPLTTLLASRWTFLQIWVMRALAVFMHLALFLHVRLTSDLMTLAPNWRTRAPAAVNLERFLAAFLDLRHLGLTPFQ